MDGPARPLAVDEDLYAVLGIPGDASAEAIRHAYRRRARACHPDVTSSAEASERFRRVAAAYEVLGHESTRRAYDRRRRSASRSSGRDPGPAPTHRAPGPSWNPAVRGPAAQVARAQPDREPVALRPERTSNDEWRLATTFGKVFAAIALVVIIAFSAMVVVTMTSERAPAPVPTIYCKTPDGWLDCLQALDPS